MMNVNQFYSESMAEDVRRGMEDNAERCMVNGIVCFGYKKGEDGRYAIDEPAAKIVEEAFVRVASLEPYVDIYNDFNRRGFKTSTGSLWNKNSFTTMLKNRRYRGVYIWGGIEKEGGIPSIISDELFYKVQEVLAMKKEAPKGRHRVGGDYLLTGKLYCGKCLSPMTGVSGTGKSGSVHYYYVCNEKKKHACNKKNVRRDETELLIATAIRDYILKPDTINWIADKTIEYNRKKEEANEIQLLKDELKQTQSGIRNLLSAMEQGIITESTKARLIELESQQAQLNIKIKAAASDIIMVDRDTLIAGLEMYKDGDIHYKKYQATLFDMFLKQVYLYDDKMKIVFAFNNTGETLDIPVGDIDCGDIDQGNEKCSFQVLNGSPKTKCSIGYFVFSIINQTGIEPERAFCVKGRNLLTSDQYAQKMRFPHGSQKSVYFHI